MDARIPIYRFLTLTFGKGFHKFNPKVLVRETLPSIYKYMRHISYGYTISMELTEQGILHYHLLVDVKDFIKYKIFNNYWTRHYGFVKSINPSNVEKTLEYIQKESNATLKQLFGINEEVITHDNIGQIIPLIKAPIEKESKTILDYLKTCE